MVSAPKSVELDDGVYQYKFRFNPNLGFEPDQWVDVTDPYATDVDNEENGVVRIKGGDALSIPRLATRRQTTAR